MTVAIGPSFTCVGSSGREVVLTASEAILAPREVTPNPGYRLPAASSTSYGG